MMDLDKNLLKQFKLDELTRHFKEIMQILEIPSNDSTIGTPRRIAKMYLDEVFANRNNHNIKEELDCKMKFFHKDYPDSDMIILKDIPFYSMCEHHFMPFSGKITVAYVPNDTIVGLSKIPRVVKYFSKKPQLQERLVNEIADYLHANLNAQAVYVLAKETVHTCVTARGVETYCDTDTIACRGTRKEDYKCEFYNRLRSV